MDKVDYSWGAWRMREERDNSFYYKIRAFSGVSLRYLYPLGLCPSNGVWCTLQSVLRRMRRGKLEFKAHWGLKLYLAKFFLDRHKHRSFLRPVSICLVPSSLRRPQLLCHTSPSSICRLVTLAGHSSLGTWLWKRSA